MKKKNILNLIKYHAENNDPAFRAEAYEIANYFDSTGNHQLAEYIMSVLSDVNTFVPQISDSSSSYFTKVDTATSSLPLPDAIADDVIGIVNAVSKNVGIHKFLFQGAPGTGKTETSKNVARILERELFIVDFESIIDSKLGQTAKNIAQLFDEIHQISQPQKVIILFDEIDALAVDRVNRNDVREMGRATSAILKGLDNLNDKIVLIATTNLYDAFDKALIRRFDFIVDFNRYEKEDLVDVAESILNGLLPKFDVGRDMRLFRKILSQANIIPYPGELKNIIKTSLAFSDSSQEFDYLRKLFSSLGYGDKLKDLKYLQTNNFTVREIEKLTGISKSQVSREIGGDKHE